MRWVCNRLGWVGLIFLSSLGWGQQQVPVPTICNSSTKLQMTTATTTQLVALVSGQKVRICAYAIQGSITATGTTLKLVYGTGTNCATSPVDLTPAWNMPASSVGLPFQEGVGAGELFETIVGNALCATNSAAGTVNIRVTYTQF